MVLAVVVGSLSAHWHRTVSVTGVFAKCTTLTFWPGSQFHLVLVPLPVYKLARENIVTVPGIQSIWTVILNDL
jgi:hypothetical protein